MKALSVLISLLVGTQPQEYFDSLDTALAGRQSQRMLCLLFTDNTDSSKQTLVALRTESIRAAFKDMLLVVLPVESEIAQHLRVTLAPTLMLVEAPETNKDPQRTPPDLDCLRRLRDVKVSMALENASLKQFVKILAEGSGLMIQIERDIDPDLAFTLSGTNLTPDHVLNTLLPPKKLGFFVEKGSVRIASEAALRDLKIRCYLQGRKVAHLFGIPELTDADTPTSIKLRQKISLAIREVEWKEAIDAVNAAIGAQVVEFKAHPPPGKISFSFSNGELEGVLSLLLRRHGLWWYQKSGKIIVSERPEIVALDESRIRNFLLLHVEGEESLIPESVAKELRKLVDDLRSESIQDRTATLGKLKSWVVKFPTSRRLLRRAAREASDQEIRGRLESVIGP